MKLSTLFAMGCVTVPVFSAVLDTRASDPGKVVVAGVLKIKRQVDLLDKSFLQINSENIDLDPLLNGAGNLTQALEDQTMVVKKITPLGDACTDYVQTYVVKLLNSVKKLARDVISKEKYIASPANVKASLPSALLLVVGVLKTDADAFADALIKKVPKDKVALAKEDKKVVDDALAAVNQTYFHYNSF